MAEQVVGPPPKARFFWNVPQEMQLKLLDQGWVVRGIHYVYGWPPRLGILMEYCPSKAMEYCPSKAGVPVTA